MHPSKSTDAIALEARLRLTLVALVALVCRACPSCILYTVLYCTVPVYHMRFHSILRTMSCVIEGSVCSVCSVWVYVTGGVAERS